MGKITDELSKWEETVAQNPVHLDLRLTGRENGEIEENGEIKENRGKWRI